MFSSNELSKFKSFSESKKDYGIIIEFSKQDYRWYANTRDNRKLFLEFDFTDSTKFYVCPLNKWFSSKEFKKYLKEYDCARFDKLDNLLVTALSLDKNDKGYFPSFLYHGTDEYCFNLPLEKKFILKKAIFQLAQFLYPLIKDSEIIVKYSKKLSDSLERQYVCNSALHIKGFIENNPLYQYDCTYVSTSPYKIINYAITSFYFGESGDSINKLINFLPKIGINLPNEILFLENLKIFNSFLDNRIKSPRVVCYYDVKFSDLLDENGKKDILNHFDFRILHNNFNDEFRLTNNDQKYEMLTIDEFIDLNERVKQIRNDFLSKEGD